MVETHSRPSGYHGIDPAKALLSLWLSLVCIVAFFHGLLTLGPMDKTEALQISIAQTMFRLGEWVVPYWNGHLYTDKPPLPYWLAMIVWRWLGDSPELARIPAAICALIGVVCIARLLQVVSQPRGSSAQSLIRPAVGATVLALSPAWIGFAHSAVHDIYLAVSICLAISGYFVGFCRSVPGRNGRLWVLWIGFWCGIGFLAKGLLGIGLPLLIMAADQLLHHSSLRRLWRSDYVLLLIASISLVVAPWIVALVRGQHWSYLDGFFGFSHLQRATTAVDGHDQSLFFYIPILLALLCPWWPLLLTSLRQFWQRRCRWRQPASELERLQQMAAVWLLLGLLIFSAIPTKLPGYVLPLVPAAALLMATTTRQERWSLRLVAFQVACLALSLLAGLVMAGLGVLGPYGESLRHDPMQLFALALIGFEAAVTAASACLIGSLQRSLQLSMLGILLLLLSLPMLAAPYRDIEQRPLQRLANHLSVIANSGNHSTQILYVVDRNRYSIVSDVNMPVVFGSPLKPVSSRPVSSYLNWLQHKDDDIFWALGRCPSIEKLQADSRLTPLRMERRQAYCLVELKSVSTSASQD